MQMHKWKQGLRKIGSLAAVCRKTELRINRITFLVSVSLILEEIYKQQTKSDKESSILNMVDAIYPS